MAIQIRNRFPGANARLLKQTYGPETEIIFTADPCGSPEALWFHFRFEDPEPSDPRPESLTLSMRFFGNHAEAEDPAQYRPVLRETGKAWNRLRAPVVTYLDDGQPLLSWTVPYPESRMEIALAHPYGKDELDGMRQKAKGYWQEEPIGLTQSGRLLPRLDNRLSDREAHGLYLIARQCPGATPSSWILDGILDSIARSRVSNWAVSAIPFADLDGVLAGQHESPMVMPMSESWASPCRRHEVNAIKADLQRWSLRCKPALVIECRATSNGEHDGIYLSATTATAEIDRHGQAWANLIKKGLEPDFASERFQRPSEKGTRNQLSSFVQETLACPCVILHAPYTHCREHLMTPKQYREAGRRVVQALLGRWQKAPRR